MDLFWLKGYEATGLKELLLHMGIARQSLYNTFGDKHSLFVKAIDHYEKAATQRLLEQLTEADSPLESLQCIISTWGFIDTPESRRGCLLVNTIAEFGASNPEVTTILQRHVDSSVHLFQQSLEQAKAKGELSEKLDTRSLACMLVNTRNGLALLRKVQADPAILQSLVEQTLSMLK